MGTGFQAVEEYGASFLDTLHVPTPQRPTWAHTRLLLVMRATGGQAQVQNAQTQHPHTCLCPHHPPGPSSKFRHAQGSILHRDSHITNLKGLNLTTPGESDGFCANRLHVAVPLLSSGGQVAVLEVRILPPAQGYPSGPCSGQEQDTEGLPQHTELCQALVQHNL